MKVYWNDESGDLRWRSEEFKILHLSQVSGLVWIYADLVEGGNGEFTLDTEPIDFIGVAKVTTSYWHQTKDRIVYEYGEPEIENRVVGLRIGPDGVEICNEYDHFAGIGRAGADIRDIYEWAVPVNSTKYPWEKLVRER